jgi:hypothetical protein
MSAYAAVYFQKHNPAVIGVLAGLGVRVAWEIGFLPSIALMLRDVGVVIWIMMNDLCSACSAFWQFVIL